MTVNVRRATPADVADIAGPALEVQDVYERLGFTSFHERMAFELGQSDCGTD